MKFQILMSTMNKTQDEVINMIKENNISSSILVINQTLNDIYRYDSKDISIISYYEKGLSKSRNRAIFNAKADICLLADDDIYYNDNVEKIIIDTFKLYSEYDLIAFYVGNSNKHKDKLHEVNFIQSLKLMSVQIAFKRKSIIDKKIFFDENFGTGSNKFICGEENIFLKECLDKGLKILYVPLQIAELSESESSWFKGYDDLFFRTKGALFYRLSNILCVPIIFAFAITKNNEYKDECTFMFALRNMLNGRREYIRMINNGKA